MPSYEVTMADQSVEVVTDAHAYQQEGQMTTFFRNEEPRSVVDSWSSRIFSVRTSEVLMIRELADACVERLPRSRPHPLRPSTALWAVDA
jgi:hypothetical protein